MLLRYLRAFRNWRGGRPFWAGVWTILAGLELLVLPLAPVHVLVLQGQAGTGPLLLGPILIALGGFLLTRPRRVSGVGILVLAATLLSFPVANLGGFLLGIVLGFVGGALAVAWQPGTPTADTRPVPAGPARQPEPPQAPEPTQPAEPAQPPAEVRPSGPPETPRHRPNAMLCLVTGLLPAVGPLCSGLPGQLAGPDLNAPAGITSTPGPNCRPDALPARPPAPGSAEAQTAARTVANCLNISGSGRAASAGGTPVLRATSLTITTFSPAGVVELPAPGGGRQRALRWRAASMTATDAHTTIPVPASTEVTSFYPASIGTLRCTGPVVVDTVRVSGKLFGVLPVVLTPDLLPARVTFGYVVLTDVEADAVGLAAPAVTATGVAAGPGVRSEHQPPPGR